MKQHKDCSISPRNGNLVVRLERPDDVLILTGSGPAPDAIVRIAAVPDGVTGYEIDDVVLTHPSNFVPITQEYAFLHSSAVLGVDNRAVGL